MIVLGTQFGDEGKGLTTSFLCSQTENPLVVRFNGGHQAGHTVVDDGNRHVFSNFGSGTLQGVPTYWGQDCTIHPTSIINEYKALPRTIVPTLIVHRHCPVVTPWDIKANQVKEDNTKHGSVGVGFGTTIQRHEDFYKLYAQDLANTDILRAKLKLIEGYYEWYVPEEEVEMFIQSCKDVLRIIQFPDRPLMDYTPIYEGAQGIMLDQDFGFFPHVTRSNTTSKNVVTRYPKVNDVFYVTRTYQTRHGAGPMTNEDYIELKNNEKETNMTNKYQGNFRTGIIDPQLIKYAIQCDQTFSKGLKKNLVVTCMDQHEIDIDKLLHDIGYNFDKVFLSYGDSKEKIIKFN